MFEAKLTKSSFDGTTTCCYYLSLPEGAFRGSAVHRSRGGWSAGYNGIYRQARDRCLSPRVTACTTAGAPGCLAPQNKPSDQKIGVKGIVYIQLDIKKIICLVSLIIWYD